MEYAIETQNLTKRFKTKVLTNTRGGPGRGGGMGGMGGGRGGGGGGVTSFAILDIIRPSKGPFIEALKDVNLQIRKGEIFGILGPNGAGKSTLIKIFCTLVIPDGGEVYINGYNPQTQTSLVLKNLQAVLPESRGFSWRLSGRQNLEFYALLYGLKDRDIKDRINYLLDFTGLAARADDGYQRYSTGMQRRLLLCRALLRDTPIIVFDEPTSGLDPTGAAEFRNMLIYRLAKKEGKTIVLSTHNLEEAELMCDRIAIIDRGKILACDTPENVRYLRIHDIILRVSFVNDGQVPETLLNELRATPGVQSLKLENSSSLDEHSLKGFSLRIPKDADLSKILEIISRSGLKIHSISTEEPTLEDAFRAITGKQPDDSDRPSRGMRMSLGGTGWR